MKEFDLIQLLTPGLPRNASVVVGAGDDCAVLDAGWPDRWQLFKTDAVVEGVHFEPDTPPERIGHKALARCLSDFAAMAGTPTSAVVTIGLPRDFDAGRVRAIYEGINALARRYDVAIVGGETTTCPERMFLSLAVIGWVPKDRCPLRSGAGAGDAIFVTGELGGSLAGRHLEFAPRLDEARWLAREFSLHALMDLSDGLAGDLRHILDASQVGAELRADSIPVSRVARAKAKAESSAKPPLLAALTDGEDFELLFTVAAKSAVSLLDAWKAKFPGVKLTCVGKITAERGLRLRDGRGVREMASHGYVHFA
jgi:thiamine-monophosphate kinase